MTSQTPFRRAWRPFVATLAISTILATGRVFAQDANDDGLQLRGDLTPSAAVPPALAEAQPSPAPGQDAANPPGPADDKDAANDQTTPDDKAKALKRKRQKPPTNRLPALEHYQKGARMGLPGGPPALDPNLVPAPNLAALPTPKPKPKPKTDDNPFDPTGVSVGDLRLTPYIEEDGGYNTNPNYVAGPTRGSMFETTTAGFGLQSDWSRNELRGSFQGGYTDYFSQPQANTPNASGTIDGRLDVSHDLSINTEGRFTLATQTPGSVSLPSGIVLGTNQRPLWETVGATLGATQKFGNLSFSLSGLVDRTTYQNAVLADGTVDDLASDDFTDWGLKGRVAYQISPIVTPFVESEIDTRRYDDVVDSSGYARTSNGVLGRAGVTLALTNQLTGEVSGGYGERHYEDARLPMLAAPLFDASLVWSATPLTKVTLKATSALNDTTIPAASGAVTRIYSIEVSHALRRYLTIGLTGSIETDNYVGVPQNDRIVNLGLKADYNVTRDIMLRASVSRQEYVTNVANSNYTADVFMLGLKLQR